MKDLDLIYVTARELPPEDRPAYLTRVCDGDQTLRARVEQMLAVSAEAEAFVTDLPEAELEKRKPGREGGRDLSYRSKVSPTWCGAWRSAPTANEWLRASPVPTQRRRFGTPHHQPRPNGE